MRVEERAGWQSVKTKQDGHTMPTRLAIAGHVVDLELLPTGGSGIDAVCGTPKPPPFFVSKSYKDAQSERKFFETLLRCPGRCKPAMGA